MKEQRKRFPLRSIPFSTQFFLQLQTSSPPPPPHTHTFSYEENQRTFFTCSVQCEEMFFICEEEIQDNIVKTYY